MNDSDKDRVRPPRPARPQAQSPRSKPEQRPALVPLWRCAHKAVSQRALTDSSKAAGALTVRPNGPIARGQAGDGNQTRRAPRLQAPWSAGLVGRIFGPRPVLKAGPSRGRPLIKGFGLNSGRRPPECFRGVRVTARHSPRPAAIRLGGPAYRAAQGGRTWSGPEISTTARGPPLPFHGGTPRGRAPAEASRAPARCQVAATLTGERGSSQEGGSTSWLVRTQRGAGMRRGLRGATGRNWARQAGARGPSSRGCAIVLWTTTSMGPLAFKAAR